MSLANYHSELWEIAVERIENYFNAYANAYGGLTMTMVETEYGKKLMNLFNKASIVGNLIPYNEDIYILDEDKFVSSLTLKEETDTEVIKQLQNIKAMITMIYD